MTMKKLNIHDLKTHFSSYLSLVEKGERLIICRRNVPIAEIRAISQPLLEQRPVGLAKGKFEVTSSFFEELPDEIIKGFLGEDENS